MRRTARLAALILLGLTTLASAQDQPQRGFLGRLLHPFSAPSGKLPEYQNQKLRGLVVSMQLPSEPINLAESRQLPVTVQITNKGKVPIELDFPTEQRIDIYLHDATGRIVTRWSDNRAFETKPISILIDPNEHLEYDETIATRDLAPGRVFTVEAVVPAYPELDAKRKLLAAP